MSDSIRQLAEHKLIILHLLQKMGIALSNSEICQFLLEKNYMDYFSVQQYLAELVDAGWLEKSREQNNTRYTLTDEGDETVNYFLNHISKHARSEINTYVQENSKRIRAEYAVTANYFPEINDDFLVKCGLHDDNGNILMEISVSVVSKQQALAICRNWRKNVSHLYGSIVTSLVKDTEAENSTFKAKKQNFPSMTKETTE